MNYKFLLMSFFAAALCSCGGGNKGLADGASGNLEEYESSDVNAIVQAKPEIMIIPSDGTLRRFGAIAGGYNGVERDYQRYLLADRDAKSIFSVIQDEFQKQDFPLNDLEQTLKQLSTNEAMDMADGVYLDAKTILMQTASPDIILELDYGSGQGGADRMRHSNGSDATGSFTLNALDAYTNKVVATVTADNVRGENKADAVRKELKNKLPDFMKSIQNYFSDILTRGREVTVRINVADGSNVTLSDINAEGDTYSDYIVDYIKRHTVKGAYKMQANTDAELRFTNVRIRMINEDGTQYGVYDWTRDLAKAMRRDLGVKVTNRSQGLGNVTLTLEEI